MYGQTPKRQIRISTTLCNRDLIDFEKIQYIYIKNSNKKLDAFTKYVQCDIISLCYMRGVLMIREVELLLKIWRALDSESQEMLKGDFTKIKEKLLQLDVEDISCCECVGKSDVSVIQTADEQKFDKIISHEYLRGLSDECVDMFFNVLSEDGKNLYHSAMAWCQSHRHIKSPTDLYEGYKRKYKTKRQYVVEYEEELIELFDHCVEKYLGKYGNSFFVEPALKEEDVVEEFAPIDTIPPPEENVDDSECLSNVAYEKFEYNGETYYYHKN